MKIKIRIELFMLYIITLSITSFFGILNINQDIVLIECIIFCLYTEIKYYKCKNTIKCDFKYLIIFIVPLILISSFQSYKLYGQDIILGIRAQRMFLIMYMMYFPLRILIGQRKISLKDIEKMIYYIGIVQLFLYMIFFVSNGSISFLKYNYDYRYGSMRLRVNSCIINLLFILAIDNYINGINKKMSLFIIIVNVLVCSLIIKTRLLIVSYIFVLIFALIFWKKNLRKKIITILCALLLIPIILNSTIISDIISAVLENDSNDIRKIGKAYYIECLEKSPILGRGYINTLCQKAFVAAGMDKNIYLVDNGIYAFAFQYGGLGIIWFGVLWLRFLRNSIYNYKNIHDYIGILYFVHLTVLLPNITWWSWTQDGMLCIVIYMSAILERKNRKREEI